MQGRADGDKGEGEVGRSEVGQGALHREGTGQKSHVRNPQEGTRLMVGSMQVTIKATGAETKGRFTLLEIVVPPYFADILPHLHHETSEAIYLTQGMLAVTLGEETMVVRQGSFILVPPMQPHRFWNPAATPATFLSYFTPAGIEEFFETLSEMELEEKVHLPSVMAEIWALGMRYDHFSVEPIAPNPPSASSVSSVSSISPDSSAFISGELPL